MVAVNEISNELTAAAADTVAQLSQDSKVRRFKGTWTLNSQEAGSTCKLFTIPKGYEFIAGIINTSASLGTTTVKIGITGATDKYKAAAVFTAVDTPTFFGKVSAKTEVSADEDVYMETAVATLPAAGSVVVEMLFGAVK